MEYIKAIEAALKLAGGGSETNEAVKWGKHQNLFGIARLIARHSLLVICPCWFN